ncbi:MAG TPA: FAD-dependent monooxygenase [Ktedonobacterales bacterium]|nr:FAD-dependent monooxygenase [Ktedonobacterales bacterium]
MAARMLADLRPGPTWRDPMAIIGAGPVGMSVALGLAHYGIPSVILDEDEGTAIEGSRSIFMERHSMEILGAWSPVGRQVAERGMTLVAGRVFFRSTELYKTFTAPPDPNIRYPRFVNFPQNALERLQYAALRETPCCAVRWRHKVTGLTQDDSGVTVQAESPDGPVRVWAPYALACDGPRSAVRHVLNLPFPGESRERHFLILDVRMELETPRERWFWFDPPFNPGRTALLHPQPENIYRLDFQLAPDDDFEEVKTPEAIHRRIVATVGERPYEVVWKSVYTYQQRALERFKHGRVLFLGDAAHLMSPFGGRGLNSGIQDAWNVVWKLALVRAGVAPDALLETYDAERRPAAQENLRLTADTMRFLTPSPGPARWRRDAILRLSLPFPAMRKRVNAGHMSNPYTYAHSPIIVADAPPQAGDGQATERARFQRGPAVGSLAPELILTDAAGGSVSLLDLFGESFVVLSFRADPDKGAAKLADARSDLPANLPISLYVIASTPPAEATPEGVTCLLDPDGACAAAYGAGPETLYLMRPDRHIAARRFASDATDLPALLRQAAGLALARTPAEARV